MSPWIIQGIGFVGMLFFLLSYQTRSNRGLFLCQMLGCSAFIVQFGLMGALSGCGSLAICTARNLLLFKAGDWPWVKSKVTLGVVLTALLAVLILTWAGPISLLAFVGVAVSSVAYWTNNPQKIRLSQLACNSPCALLYDLLVGSWGGVVSECISMGSILLSIYRFGWKNLDRTEQA